MPSTCNAHYFSLVGHNHHTQSVPTMPKPMPNRRVPVSGLSKDNVKDTVKCEMNQTSSNHLNSKATHSGRPPKRELNFSLLPPPTRWQRLPISSCSPPLSLPPRLSEPTPWERKSGNRWMASPHQQVKGSGRGRRGCGNLLCTAPRPGVSHSSPRRPPRSPRGQQRGSKTSHQALSAPNFP